MKRPGTHLASVLMVLLLGTGVGTAAVLVPTVVPLPVPPFVNLPVPPVKDFPEVPDQFDVIDVEASFEWSTEILEGGTEVEFTSAALVELDERPPQEDIGYRLQLFIRNNGPEAISVEGFVLNVVTPPFARAALAEVDIDDSMLQPGEQATLTLVLFVDSFFLDPDEDLFKLNAHHQARVRDSTDVLNHLGMNVMFRA